jgi:hypothetical protein
VKIFLELKIAGAASLQRDRDREISSQSELGQFAPGYKLPSSNTNINGGVNFSKNFSGKTSVNTLNTADVVNLNSIPSSRQLVSKPYSNAATSASNNRLIRNFSRSQVDSGGGVQRDSVSIDKKPLLNNKMITNREVFVNNS